MERIFCKDKKDFCDGAEDCTKCQYAKGNGLIAGYVAQDLLCTLFGNNYDLDRLRELVNADREGRCTIFPCRDWLDLVFGEQEVFYEVDMDYMENPIREITVRSDERVTWYGNDYTTVVLRGRNENGCEREFLPEEVGKTVFRTREEAEATLKKRNGNDLP